MNAMLFMKGVERMKIKLFDGGHKRIENAVNEFFAQNNIKVIEIKMETSINGTVVMVVYEENQSGGS